MAKIIINAWSDVICPWCWIGDLRLEKALHNLPYRKHVEVRHRSYRLMPGLAPESVLSVMSRKTGGDETTVRGMFAQVEAVAREEGLQYDIARTIAGDTFDVHRLIKWADGSGLADAAFERFYRAHFVEGRSVFDYETLVDLTIELGLDGREAKAVLEDGRFGKEVEADQAAAISSQLQGVPFYMIGKHGVSGAQSVEAFAMALSQAWSDSASLTTEGSAVCGPDGCH